MRWVGVCAAGGVCSSRIPGGLGNRQSIKIPTLVTALGEDKITMIGAGADFTVCVTEAGTVFAWGSNAAGQLGRAPIEDPGSDAGDNSRVLVMKTTKRIIRLQHGLQNSCDVPRPVHQDGDVLRVHPGLQT